MGSRIMFALQGFMLVNTLGLCSLRLLTAPEMYSINYFFRLPVIVLQRVLFVVMLPSLEIHV